MGDFFQTIIDLVNFFLDILVKFVTLVVGVIKFFTTLGGILPGPIGAMLIVLLAAMLVKAVINR